MTTIAAPFPSALPPPDSTASVLLRGVSWRGYRTLIEEIGDGAVRLTYDDGLLEIEVPSKRHEELKKLAAALVETALDVSGTDYQPLGSTTWNREESLKGIEADECYYVQNMFRIRGKTIIDLATDPPPDLAIEVEVSISAIDKLRVYAALRVPEVWRVGQDASLRLLRQNAQGQYEPVPESTAVPKATVTLLQEHLKLLEPIGPLVHSAVVRRFRAALSGDRPTA